jgi:hypothetical protein
VENVHRHDKPFILHSGGNLKLVMKDLIEYVRIDAKHSYEDAFQYLIGYFPNFLPALIIDRKFSGLQASLIMCPEPSM